MIAPLSMSSTHSNHISQFTHKEYPTDSFLDKCGQIVLIVLVAATLLSLCFLMFSALGVIAISVGEILTCFACLLSILSFSILLWGGRRFCQLYTSPGFEKLSSDLTKISGKEVIQYKYSQIASFFRNCFTFQNAVQGIYANLWVQAVGDLQLPNNSDMSPEKRVEREFSLVLLSYFTSSEMEKMVDAFHHIHQDSGLNNDMFLEFLASNNKSREDALKLLDSIFSDLKEWLEAAYPEAVPAYQHLFSGENRRTSFNRLILNLLNKNSLLKKYPKFVEEVNIFNGRQASLLACLPGDYCLKTIQQLHLSWENLYTLCILWRQRYRSLPEISEDSGIGEERWNNFILQLVRRENISLFSYSPLSLESL